MSEDELISAGRRLAETATQPLKESVRRLAEAAMVPHSGHALIGGLGWKDEMIADNQSGPTGPKWVALVKAHRATGEARPSLIKVAEKMGWTSEQPLRDLCRELGIRKWHDVHALVAATPD